jgi:hypothetical protein
LKTLNILSIFIVISGLVFSQNYPVQTTIQLTAPYTSYLPDYTDGINSKLQVALNITDVNEPILQVKLKFTLEGPGGKIVTNPNFIQSPITLNFGEVLILSGDELSPYLAFDNLVFPSQTFEQNYRQTKVLPEGLWKLCVDVIDATNPSSELLSMNNCALIFVARLQPPMLNIPICETTLPRAQNIFFSWTDMALGSQAIGQEPLYDFSLYSVPLSAYNNPTQVLNTNPIFSTTTTVASFSLDTNEVFLPAGQKYLWQVRAKLPDGSGAYLNNGYSAPCTFVFGDLAQEIVDDLSINLTAQGRGPTYGTASWTLTSASGSTQTFESYVISYRKAGNPYYGWYEDAVVGNQFDIKQLEDSTLYEVKIKGIIGESETEYTDIVTFRTLPYPSYACGDGNIRPLSPTYTPLANENAYAGIKVEQGQFFMEVTSIEPNGMGAGRFKGTGKIKVDFLFVSVRVSFDNLLIDSDYTAREGVVNVITQGLDEWLKDGYLDQVTPIVVTGTITDGVFTNDTTVVVTTTDGTHTFVFENDLPIVVHGDGNVEYQFWADGTIVITTFGITPSADNLDASAQRNIRFKASPNQEYGFDGLEYAAWKNKHEVIICSDQFQYVVPHKSMSQQASDVVYAVLKGNIPDRTQISFKLLGGTTGLSFSVVDDSTYAITLPSRSFSYKIYAYYGLEKLGKLSVEAYETKTKKVRIVPISNVALNASQITNSLNKTYKDANINFDVSIAAPYTSSLFTSQTLFTNPNTTLLAKYTEQMRQLRDEYLATNSLENDEYLLFSIAGFQDQSIDGYMVRGRALGFIKASTDTSQLFTAIAHELGHGIGGLRHTWDDQGPTQASTNNLMDYAGGRKLIKEQWEKMRDPGIVIALFDEEEDAQMQEIAKNIAFLDITDSYPSTAPNSCTNYLLLSGKIIKFNRVFNYEFSDYYLVNIIDGNKVYTTSSTLDISTKTGEPINVDQPSITDDFINWTAIDLSIFQPVTSFDLKSTTPQKLKKDLNGGNIVSNYYLLNIPSQFYFSKEEYVEISCSSSIEIASQEGCVTVTESFCESLKKTGSGTKLPTINPKVEKATIKCSDFAFQGNARVLPNGMPVLTTSFTNIIANEYLLSFTKDNINYIALNEVGGGFVGFVNEERFDLLKASKAQLEWNDFSSSDKFLLTKFEQAGSSDKIYTRSYINNMFCCFKEYALKNTVNNYEFDGTLLSVLKYNDSEIAFNSGCPDAFQAILCESFASGFAGIAALASSVTELFQIEEKYYNPMRSDYDPTYYTYFTLFGGDNSQLNFAIMAGVLNQLGEEIQGIADLGGFITTIFCDAEFRENLWTSIPQLKTIIQQSINDEIAQLSGNPYLQAEFIGRSIVFSATMIIPLSKVNWIGKIAGIKNLSQKTIATLIRLKKSIVKGSLSLVDDSRKIVYNSITSGLITIATIGDNGAVQIKKWIDGPIVEIRPIGECEILLDNGLLETRNLSYAKNSSGEWGFVSGVIRVNWNGFANIFKANADEILEAINRIKNHRTTTGNLSGGNYGYLEGTVNGVTVDNKMWRSGQADLMIEPQIFDAIPVTGNNGGTWLRNTDSEYKMLNKLADDLGGVNGNTYPNVIGEFKIVSENPYCSSCQGIIQQFHDMFPNVKLILVDGAK